MQAQVSGARKPAAIKGGVQDPADEVAHLLALGTAALRQCWLALFGAKPSPCLGRVFMARAIAYRLQERTLGSLKASTCRLLDRVGDGRSEATMEDIPKPRSGAGTVLIRQWRGVSHRVVVLDQDVIYRGQRYKSLSEVARVITGTRWSGPLFFGLKGRAREKVTEAIDG